VAALATGFSGFGKALKFVAPAAGGAAGGMDAAAKAAKSAARSIAAATRSVEDALRDQARTVRDTGRQIANAQRSLQDAIVSAAKANVDAAKRVRDAQRDLGDALKNAAKSAQDNAERVADAQRNVARTAENAARSVVSASRSLQSSIKNEANAQKGLNDARRVALEQLADLKERVSDLALDQEGAAIALIEAQQNLEKVNSDALSTELDRRKAQYELATAQERVNDVTEEASKAAKDNAEAIKKGVDGNEAVIDAQERLKDAQQSVIDSQDEYRRAVRDAAEANAEAQKQLTEAYEQAAEDQIASQRRVADAQESLSEAQQAQADTAKQGARDVADAQTQLALAEESAAEAREDAARRVEDAMRSLAQAQEDAAESMKQAASAAAGAEDPINKLSPAAQAVVRSLRALGEEWKKTRREVQEAMFAGIAAEIDELGRIYMPIVREGLVGIAKEFNTAGKEASAFLKEQQTQDDARRGFELTRQVVANLTKALQPLLRVLRDVGIVSLEVFTDITGGAGSATERLADFVAKARETGDLRKFIERGVQGFRDLWGIIRDVTMSLDAIFDGLTGGDQEDFLANLAAGAAAMRAFLESAKGQDILRELGAFLDRMATNTLRLLSVAFEYLFPVVQKLQPLFEDLSRVFIEVFAGALAIIGPMLQGVADVLSFLSPVISPLLGFLLGLGIAWKTLGIILRVFIPLLGLLFSGIQAVITIWRLLSLVFMANPWVLLIIAIVALVALIIANWDAISAFLVQTWDWIVGKAKEFGAWFYDTLIQPFVDVYYEIKAWWTNIKADFQSGLTVIGEWWDRTWTKVQGKIDEFTAGAQAAFEHFFGWFYDDTTGNLKSVEQMWDDWRNGVRGMVTDFCNWLLGFFGTNMNQVQDAIRNGITNIMTWWRELPGNIMGWLRGLPATLQNAGRDAVIGLWNGFTSMGSWLYNNIMGWVRNYIPGPVLEFLGIASPSKYFRDEIGKMIPAGLMVGINSMNGKVADTASGMAETALSAARATMAAGDLSSIAASGAVAQMAEGVGIAGAATLTRAAVGATVAATPNSPEPTAEGDAGTTIGTLVLNVAGNLDPTNKLAWDQAMDSIREGINKREKARK
jgi:phage-related protein